MFEFLKIQYELGKISCDKLKKLVGKKITQEQYNLLIGIENDKNV